MIMKEYYLLILLPEHIALQLRRSKTLYFQQTGDESFYKYPCALIVGKTLLKDPPHNRFNFTLTPDSTTQYIENKNYLCFKENKELLKLQQHFNIKDGVIGIPISNIEGKYNFTLPPFAITKFAILIKEGEEYIIRR